MKRTRVRWLKYAPTCDDPTRFVRQVRTFGTPRDAHAFVARISKAGARDIRVSYVPTT